MKTSENLLVAGFVCAAVGAGLSPFVMIGLIGLVLSGVAFGFLLRAGEEVHSASNIPGRPRAAARVLYLAGVLLLLAISWHACSQASDAAVKFQRAGLPGSASWDWMLLGLQSLLPPFMIALSLRWRAGWAWRGCALCGVGAACVCPTAVLIFWMLEPVLPLAT